MVLDLAPDAVPLALVDHVGPRQGDHLGTCPTRQRLEQVATWEHMAKPEWFECVDQHDVEISHQPAVLKTVVK